MLLDYAKDQFQPERYFFGNPEALSR